MLFDTFDVGLNDFGRNIRLVGSVLFYHLDQFCRIATNNGIGGHIFGDHSRIRY